MLTLQQNKSIECYNKAISCMQIGNFLEGINYFEQAADLGHPDAMQELADIYLMPGILH